MKYALSCKSYFPDITKYLYRIKALVEIPEHGVNIDDEGGWVEGTWNLSQENSSWIYEQSFVIDNGWVGGDAWISGAMIQDNGIISSHAVVTGQSVIQRNAMVTDSSYVISSIISDSVILSGETFVKNCYVFGDQAIRDKNLINQDYARRHWYENGQLILD